MTATSFGRNAERCVLARHCKLSKQKRQTSSKTMSMQGPPCAALPGRRLGAGPGAAPEERCVRGRPAPDAVASVLGTIGGVLLNFAPLLLLIGLNILASRGGPGGPGGGPMGQMQVGKSKSQIQMEPNTGVTFEDVAGCDGSKQELTEVVDFLKNPAKYSALGAKIPRGAIMEGPPGTGKTLLARAVAGEAGVPFVSASGS